METSEMNRRAVRIMEDWDPFFIGSGNYDPKIAGVVDQLHLLDDPSGLAKQIQILYESIYGKWIPLEKCVAVSYKLLALKFEAKCII